MSLTPLQMWQASAISGLSCINFLEQNLDLKELSLVMDGWAAWAAANLPKDVKDEDRPKLLTVAFNRYSDLCQQAGGRQLASWKNCVEGFKNREKYT
jgi:hypothetical protein